MVMLELEYLHDLGRIGGGAFEVLGSLGPRIGLTVCDLDFTSVIEASLGVAWTRDPFDRVIVGHARAGGGRLLTHDRNIRRHAPEALW